MDDSTPRTRVLLTGATGRIGTAFRAYVGERYALRLATHRRPIEDPGPHEVVTLDVASLEDCRRACRGMDVVVHLAAEARGSAGFYEVLLDSNIKGAYNILQAALDEGCRRVVLASSVQAVDAYPLDVQVHEDMPVCPNTMYGAAKCFAEATARYFATKGLSCIVVRIGTFDAGQFDGQWVDLHRLSKYISQRDMCQLLVRCVEAPDVPFALLHASSDNRFKRLDIRRAREVVGYAPEDDAFALFGDALREGDLWRT